MFSAHHPIFTHKRENMMVDQILMRSYYYAHDDTLLTNKYDMPSLAVIQIVDVLSCCNTISFFSFQPMPFSISDPSHNTTCLVSSM